MNSEKKTPIGPDSIRGLVQDLSERLDARANVLREQTDFAGSRPSDAKTFMMISRRPRSLSELAQVLGITRQAAHKSLQRLIEMELVSFEYVEGSKRDKIARITQKGQNARAQGLGIAASIEKHVHAALGEKQTDELRHLLKALIEATPFP
ncbi:MarR family winged helix-turn-helix transcriptional regulator [Polycladidibacter hongkongensis]|uniref:MarR family winged helix-turn-helix transcriptional regulator n=1 Tax=Polycladidibacter hongkongensis TaxID=1647556 RepID=UPI000835F14B|nr:MarR family winged helix-turn-helix transcriptional regulator [Pseudovibrio hongkongensis]